MIKRLTVDEVAEAVGRNPQTVRRACAAGELHGTQNEVRGHWRIREDCAEAWADKQPCEHQLAAAKKNVTQIDSKRSA